MLLGTDALRFGTWDAALSFLGEQARTAPLTIILDEFQWLKHAQPALDSVIQRHWDRWDRAALPVTLVLAGSALTLMEQLGGPRRNPAVPGMGRGRAAGGRHHQHPVGPPVRAKRPGATV